MLNEENYKQPDITNNAMIGKLISDKMQFIDFL